MTETLTESGIDLPFRQLLRLRTEMGIAGSKLTGAMFRDQPMIAIEFGTVARVCLPEWVGSGRIVRPDAPTRGISIRQLALSLGNAPETTRRHVRLLERRGALVAIPAGVALAPTDANAALVARYCLGVRDLMLRLIVDIDATCDLGLPVGAPARFRLGDVVQHAIEILLLPVDTFRPAGLTRMAFLIFGALTAVAVRDITYDAVLSRRWANAIPPDDVRTATSLRRIAESLSVPYASVWRAIHALHAAGLVTRVGTDRWTVLTRNLLDDRIVPLAGTPSVHVYRKVRELALLGLDAARAADLLRAGRAHTAG